MSGRARNATLAMRQRLGSGQNRSAKHLTSSMLEVKQKIKINPSEVHVRHTQFKKQIKTMEAMAEPPYNAGNNKNNK